MPWSHHSHSGQFCGHAVDSLEQVVQAAIQKGMTTFCLTEHMPREDIDLYSEEIGIHTEQTLAKLYDDFYHEARRLQTAYSSQIELLVGFEGDWIRPSSLVLTEQLLSKYPVDMFIGSVHHTLTYPIDIDHTTYNIARDTLGGPSDEKIFMRYFDDQHEMLRALQPPVVGHFDLIRLKSTKPDASFTTFPEVWSRIERNLRFIAGYGGVLELNFAALRKGMREVYPQNEICQVFKNLGGRFTISDDSHGVAQIAGNYAKLFDCIDRVGITSLYHLTTRNTESPQEHALKRFKHVTWEEVSVEQIKQHQFWSFQR